MVLLGGYLLHGLNSLVVENPSCLHTTTASLVPQKSSQTVPHVLLLHTSTRPSFGTAPLTSLISPMVPVTVQLNVNA